MAIDFQPHPDIAPSPSAYAADPDRWLTHYKHDYQRAKAIIAAEPPETQDAKARAVVRALIQNDLFFIVSHVMEVPLDVCNKPYVVDSCREMDELGLQASDLLSIESREHFKAIDINEPVWTPDGWRSHGSLEIGDRVFGPDGAPVAVVGKTRVFTDADCYRITFTGGYSLVCSGEHLWAVTRRDRTVVRPTKELYHTNKHQKHRIAGNVMAPQVRTIVRIEAVPSIPVSCIQVDRQDGLYLVGKNMVTTHNSTVKTLALTIKRVVNDPDCCTAIFSFKKEAANDFVRSIKETFERPLLIWAFPEIFYSNPNHESPSWSVQNGICVKRNSVSRRENTVEGFGLVEGMPIGGHFDHRIYDDIETWDISKSPDQMNLCYNSFEMSFSVGKEGGTELIQGTYYHHNGPLARIRDKVKAGVMDADGKPVKVYKTIIKPCTHDGTRGGKPVLFTPEYLQKCIDKSGKNFDSQYLCNPSPVDEVLMDKGMLKPLEPEFLRVGQWRDRFKFMIVDQAGDKETNLTKSKGDRWSIGIVSIVPSAVLTAGGGVPPTDEDLGISDVCLEDLVVDQMTHSGAVEAITRMYLRHGMIMQFGVEKVGLSTTEIHVASALAAKGRKLSEAHGNLVLVRPAGRSTEQRVTAALHWPLTNGHLHYSTAIPQEYLDRLFMEMDQFGFNHPDALNMWAYAFDMFRAFPFARYAKRKVVSVTSALAAGGGVRGGWGG